MDPLTPRYRSSMPAHDVYTLPVDLPVPEDDGACDHLPGRSLPDIELSDSDGRPVHLARLPGLTVLFVYPAMGPPDREPVGGIDAWNAIPGARGCTPQACAYRDHHPELLARGVRLIGLSAQPAAEQREAATRLGLPFTLVSDAGLSFARRLGLPTLSFSGGVLLRRVTLVIQDGRIEHVFYPVFPPDRDAERVVEWLSRRDGGSRAD